MPHIHTNIGEHDHTVSAFIVRKFDDGEWRLLLHMHKKLQSLLQIGGHIELNETPWQALKHEVKEEAGYNISELDIILSPPKLGLTNTDEQYAPFSLQTHPFDAERTHFHTDASYAFVAHAEPNLPLADGESKDLRWISESELLSIAKDKIYSNVRELGIYVLRAVASSKHNSTVI